MHLPPVRALALSVAAALAAISAAESASAAPSNVRVDLESVSSLDPARAQTPDGEAMSIASAERIEGSPEDELHLIGDAEVRHAGTVLTADRITYVQRTDEVSATGNARMSREGVSFSGPSMQFRLTSRSGSMDEADWEYGPRNVRGCAKNVRFLSGDRTTFEDVTLTTCKRGDDSWYISMNEMEIDEYDQTASGTGALLHFQGVPILGTPWFAFPISGERRSGILTPTYGMSSTRGVDIAVPYYFNLAPNYDYTLTPRVMSKRGVMLGNEIRAKYYNFEGLVDVNYLPNDRLTSEKRWSAHIAASYRWDKLAFNMDYNRVSDDDFLTDFSGSIRESSEAVLPQDYALSWTDTYWNARLRVTQNQTLRISGVTTIIPYEREPQFVFNGYAADVGGFELSTVFDATHFTHPFRMGGTRVVANQTVSYPLRGAGWFIIPKAEFMGAWYELEDMSRDAYYNGRDSNPSRYTHTLSLDAGLVFERDSSYFGRSAFQTLEPRIYYAYTPYRNQDDIPVFDSTVTDLSFATLFTPNLYSGYDRVSEANQLTAVLSTRYIDRDTGLELFRASVGQRQYFSDQNVRFIPEEKRSGALYDPYYAGINDPNTDVRSDLLGSVGARLTRDLYGSATVQYSSSLNRVVKAKTGVTWKPDNRSVLGLYYRYNYSATSTGIDGDNIKQIDFQMQWPITERLYALFRYNYSLYRKKPIELIGGFEWLDDCWTLRFAAQRYTTAANEEETNFFLQLELNGLGSIGINPLNELRRNIRGYQSTNPLPTATGPYDYYD
ncbi:MAG: LPS-assembly protein LptD [Sutterella sp.]|nr:LPS-assembly protein LptD [Sutterella sp.]